MRFRAVIVIVAAFALIATASSTAQQRGRLPGRPSQETLDARAQQEREWEEIMERIRAADKAWRERWDKLYQETREEREDFQRTMKDYSDRFSKPADTDVETTVSLGDDALPESGEVWWVTGGFITHRAAFDADGNTDGFVQTPDGRALESLATYAPRDGSTQYSFSDARDREGRTRIGEAKFTTGDGRRGTIRFNHDGVPYWGEFFTDGVRSGGFYDPSLETEDPPPRDLQVPPLVRPVTQPCEECRDVAEEHNDIVRQMAEMRAEIVELADSNQFTDPGFRRQAIEARHEVLMNRWTALAPSYEDALARLRDCSEMCNRPEPEDTALALPDAFLATAPNGSSMALTPPSGPATDVFQLIIVQSTDDARFRLAPQPAAGGPAAAMRRVHRINLVQEQWPPYPAARAWMYSPLLAAAAQGQLQELAMSVIATGQSSGNVFDVFAAALGGGGGRGGEGRGGRGRGGAGAFDLLAPDGLVLQPLAEQAQQAVQQAVPQVPGNLVKQLVGFCLDFAKPPPDAGAPYQIAPQSLQQQFRPLRHVMNTAQRLNDLGLLNPDSEPGGYLNFVKQWSLWSMMEQWDQAGFARAFAEHTRKIVEAGGGSWDDQARAVIDAAVPGRWQDIQRVVDAARPLVENERRQRP